MTSEERAKQIMKILALAKLPPAHDLSQELKLAAKRKLAAEARAKKTNG